MLKRALGLVGGVVGIPRTDRYDSRIKAATPLHPRLVLVISRVVTLLSLLISVVLLILYSSLFSFSHPFLYLPSLYLLACFILESFDQFDASPLMLLLGVYVSWKRLQVEQELPYAMLFLNQVLSLGIPIETALRELGHQETLQALVSEMKHPVLVSRPISEFVGFVSQCQRVGVTPQALQDLVVMSATQKERALSRLRSLSAMASHVFTYVLALYTCTVLVIIVTALNAGSSGSEFLLLDVVNPLLFAAGFLYLVKGWSG